MVDHIPDRKLAEYSYLGAKAVVKVESTEANLQYTLAHTSGTNDPDTGDIYTGLDRFGRVKAANWINPSPLTGVSQIAYGYDRASNRIWRDNLNSSGTGQDWVYSYDDSHRLKKAERGSLDSTRTSLSSPQAVQCWTLDETGNWKNFRQDNNGNSLPPFLKQNKCTHFS